MAGFTMENHFLEMSHSEPHLIGTILCQHKDDASTILCINNLINGLVSLAGCLFVSLPIYTFLSDPGVPGVRSMGPVVSH